MAVSTIGALASVGFATFNVESAVFAFSVASPSLYSSEKTGRLKRKMDIRATQGRYGEAPSIS